VEVGEITEKICDPTHNDKRQGNLLVLLHRDSWYNGCDVDTRNEIITINKPIYSVPTFFFAYPSNSFAVSLLYLFLLVGGR
jgi:hypothetical protein